MSDFPGGGPTDPALTCLDGGPAPTALRDHWRSYQALPKAARLRIWELIALGFDDANRGSVLADHVQEFAAAYGCPVDTVGQALDACRFVTSRAIAKNLPLADFERDLSALAGENRDGIDELCQHYEAVGSRRRGEIVQASLLDHGRLLTDIRWRIDTVAASSRASGIAMRIVQLTLAYQEGHGAEAERGHITLQMLPEATAQLRALCDQLDASVARELGPRS